MRRSCRLLLTLFLPGLLLILGGCQDRDPEAQPEAPVVRPVKSMVLPEHGGMTRTFPGTVRATRRVELSFKVSGKLIELPVKEGQMVSKGELLARLDSRDQEAVVEAAEAEYHKALADYRRAEELMEKDYVSKAHFDRTRAQKDVAASRLARARKALEDTYMRAPFDGLIALRHVENFTDVRAKQPVLSLQDPSALEVVVDIPEDMVALYRAAVPMTIKARFSSLPGREFPLSIREFAAQADPVTRTYQMVLTLADHQDVNLLPGMTAEVSVTQGNQEKGATPAFTLPASALFEADGRQWVWVIDPGTHRVSRREVQAEKPHDGMVVVLQGLQPNELVATAGVHHLKEGMVVKPVTEIRY